MITLIAAIADNGCIGVNGKLPWSIPEDMTRFKALTMGKTVLMGRKTWESLPAKFRPLPGRTNIVISRQTRYDVPVGVLVYPSLDAALAQHPDVVVIGGADIYTQALPRADRLEITHVARSVNGDAFFPAIAKEAWRETTRQDHVGFSFVSYARSGSTLIATQINATQNNADFLYPELSYNIRAACFEVWKAFGGAFKESVVERALTLALQQRGINVETQKRITIAFDGVTVGTYIPDIIADQRVLIELKCKPLLLHEDERQFWYYLKASTYRLGFLINFGPKRLDIRRRVYDRARGKHQSSDVSRAA